MTIPDGVIHWWDRMRLEARTAGLLSIYLLTPFVVGIILGWALNVVWG